jgi:hypothetical protein
VNDSNVRRTLPRLTSGEEEGRRLLAMSPNAAWISGTMVSRLCSWIDSVAAWRASRGHQQTCEPFIEKMVDPLDTSADLAEYRQCIAHAYGML